MPGEERQPHHGNKGEEIVTETLSDAAMVKIAENGIRQLKKIARDSQLPPRQGETQEGQAIRLMAERSTVLAILGRFGIVPDLNLLEPDD